MEPEASLSGWVREHEMSWEIAPLREAVGHERATVGFELRLYAKHGTGARADPGCPECVALFERMRAVALAALPQEHRPTRYDIEPFDAAFHMRPESQWQPELQLTLRIAHREGYLRSVDECEKRCAEEIQRALRGLGVQPKSWSQVKRTESA